MSAVAVVDAVATAAFLVALVATLAVRVGPGTIRPQLRLMVLVAFSLYLFVGISNVAEWAGLTDVLDAYEDYAEVLFVPLIAYILYSRSTTEQLNAATAAERAIRVEHELLTSVVDTTPTGILVVDDTGRVTFANDIARRMLQLRESDDDTLVCRWCSLGPVVPTIGGTLDLAAIATAAPVSNVLQTCEEFGRMQYLSVSATPLTETDAGHRRAVLALEEVTGRVLAERELEEYRQDLERVIDRRTGELLAVNRELEEANRAKQEFLANMSHELRTPLNSIIGFTDVMLQDLAGPLSAEQRRQLEMVKSSSTDLLGFVNNVLDLARIDAGHSAVKVAEVELGPLLTGIAEAMRPLADARGLELRCEAPPAVSLATDGDKLTQVIRNLLSNAIKFTDRGGTVRITVDVEPTVVRVSVSDTGIGIPESDHERIFEAFAQIDTPERTKPQGTGLGLAICKDLCDLLGMGLELESAVGTGSTFTVTVPRRPARAHAARG